MKSLLKTPVPDMARILLPGYFRTDPEEVAFFDRELKPFVPPDVFDAHAHLYDLTHLANAFHLHEYINAEECQGKVGYNTYQKQSQSWMDLRAPRDGLFFAMPAKDLNVAAANQFVKEETHFHPGSRKLLLIKPGDDPAAVESQVRQDGWAGFKVYHVYADHPQTQDAFIGDFLPEWAWEISDRFGLAIMLHMVRARSLADEDNQIYITAHCRRYPGANLILAHAARGFCAHHTVEGIDSIASLDNVFFDTSAICEAAPFEAILKTFGPTRLLFGSDFPISAVHGKSISLGDSFHWIYEWHMDRWDIGKPILVGFESLLALRQACTTRAINDTGIEQIFCLNARELLRI